MRLETARRGFACVNLLIPPRLMLSVSLGRSVSRAWWLCGLSSGSSSSPHYCLALLRSAPKLTASLSFPSRQPRGSEGQACIMIFWSARQESYKARRMLLPDRLSAGTWPIFSETIGKFFLKCPFVATKLRLPPARPNLSCMTLKLP